MSGDYLEFSFEMCEKAERIMVCLGRKNQANSSSSLTTPRNVGLQETDLGIRVPSCSPSRLSRMKVFLSPSGMGWASDWDSAGISQDEDLQALPSSASGQRIHHNRIFWDTTVSNRPPRGKEKKKNYVYRHERLVKLRRRLSTTMDGQMNNTLLLLPNTRVKRT